MYFEIKSFYNIKFVLVATFILFLCFSHSAAGQSPTDSDHDGLSDYDEIHIYHTDPNKADTDGDGFSDGSEIKNGFSPLVKGKKLRDVDTDHDGLWDDWEIALGTDLTNPDTDGDGFKDGAEVMSGHDPLSSDPHIIQKRIDVDLKTQRLTYYFGDKALDSFLISSGLPGTPTPPGTYTVLEKKPVVDYKGPGYDFPNTKWNLMFKKGSSGLNFYVHGAYWNHNFGTKRSHGCINVPMTEDYMGRLYDWADVGTPIVIH